MDKEILKEFKIYRDQVFQRFEEYDNILQALISTNSDAIDEIIVSMLEKDGGSNV